MKHDEVDATINRDFDFFDRAKFRMIGNSIDRPLIGFNDFNANLRIIGQ